MATLKKYDLSGKEVGFLDVEDGLLEVKAHPQSLKDYLVAIRNNARQWSASTKTRAEINRTGKKPHPQKGGGRSRQGDLAAPQYKGGGIVFGPRPKFDVHVRINRKEKKAAIAALLVEKMKSGQVRILSEEKMQEPKTKRVAEFFDKLSIAEKRVLVLGNSYVQKEESDLNLERSIRNLPKKEFCPVGQINGYVLAKARDLVVLESAWDHIIAFLKGGSRGA